MAQRWAIPKVSNRTNHDFIPVFCIVSLVLSEKLVSASFVAFLTVSILMHYFSL